jgi:hypothetical protein
MVWDVWPGIMAWEKGQRQRLRRKYRSTEALTMADFKELSTISGEVNRQNIANQPGSKFAPLYPPSRSYGHLDGSSTPSAPKPKQFSGIEAHPD